MHEQWQADGFRDDAQSADYRQRAGDWAAQYVEHVDAADEPLGVERTVAWICGLHHVRETIPFARLIERLTP